MANKLHLSTTQRIYDERAPTYDTEGGFHPRQAADYIQWMSLKPGFHVLDLACGTGAITIAAKKVVGPTGKVIGVDISSRSLSIATAKAERDGLDIEFVQHDISALHELSRIEEETFDVVSCASAVALLEDPAAAIKGWARLLKPGGRLIFDVPTKHSMIVGHLVNVVANQLQVPNYYDRTKFDTTEKVQKMLTDAGLHASDSFISEDYGADDLDSEKASEIYDKAMENKLFKVFYAGIQDSLGRDRVKEVFCEKLKEMAGPDGKVKQELRFHMAVGRKI